jgi:hypothetical protein
MGSGGSTSSLVSLDAGTPLTQSVPIARPITPRGSAVAAIEVLKKFDASSGSCGAMIPLAGERQANLSSVPIALGLHLLRPKSGSRGHALSLPMRPPSAGLAGAAVGVAARPVTPRGPLTALLAHQTSAATSEAASTPLLHVRRENIVLYR